MEINVSNVIQDFIFKMEDVRKLIHFVEVIIHSMETVLNVILDMFFSQENVLFLKLNNMMQIVKYSVMILREFVMNAIKDIFQMMEYA